jgi:uncharacterized membrane protein
VTETTQSGLSDNAAGALAYFTFIPALIFLLVEPYNKNSFVRFHAWQSILLTFAAFIIDIAVGVFIGISSFFMPWFLHVYLWPIVELAWLIVWLVCILNAFGGKRTELPIIGRIAAQQSGSQAGTSGQA